MRNMKKKVQKSLLKLARLKKIFAYLLQNDSSDLSLYKVASLEI